MHPQRAPNSDVRPLLLQPSFWTEGKPTKASQHDFLATCIDGNVEKNVKHAHIESTSRGMCAPMGSLPTWKGATMRSIRIQNNQQSLEHCSILCIVQFCSSVLKNVTPHTNPYISETAFSHRYQKKKYTYPPQGTEFGTSNQKFTKKCQNPPCWRTTNIPERYSTVQKIQCCKDKLICVLQRGAAQTGNGSVGSHVRP